MKSEEDILVDDLIKDVMQSKIIIYNDDVNSFDNVINCLIKYCNHTNEQAEQCAYIIHTKGKYKVKTGSFEKLLPICEALVENNLNAKIEE
jgi:ATP-dependent Clp protease adaptor protein ClpS